MLIDGEEHTQNWSGYDEQTAIAQAFTHHAQHGARSLSVVEITQK